MLNGLNSGWIDTAQRQLLVEKRFKELPLLSELAHPAVQICQAFDPAVKHSRFSLHRESTKCAGFAVIEGRDKSVGAGWRSAIVSHQNSHWIAFADTHDAFHKSSPAQFKRHGKAMLPTSDDDAVKALQLSRDQVERMTVEWRSSLVRTVITVFAEAWKNGTGHAGADLPEPPPSFLPLDVSAIRAHIKFELLRDEAVPTDTKEALSEEALVQVILTLSPSVHVSQPIGDTLVNTIMPTLETDEVVWGRNVSYTNDGDLLCIVELSPSRVEQLLYASEVEGDFELPIAETEPTTVAHYVHQRAIVDSIVLKVPMRSACGAWFVSSQNPASMDVCDRCVDELPNMSAVKELLLRRIAENRVS
ncbi:DUF3039 domain-containing protein [Salinibacterium sp. PAMC 21357]|uniref:DUF3039 domain-containing protein n=1 Tax=Salinibacterium sp. PAMC 21357 TaxID=1112215 RepID=UPI0005854721|nr:DUF3039 domain-containing protein [Salinibacterium sp. PAMC 21357]